MSKYIKDLYYIFLLSKKDKFVIVRSSFERANFNRYNENLDDSLVNWIVSKIKEINE